MIASDAVFNYQRFFNTLIQITQQQTGLTMVNQHNTGPIPQLPYATFHALTLHEQDTADVVRDHQSTFSMTVSMAVHAQYGSDAAMLAEMLLTAFQSQPARAALRTIDCGVQTFDHVALQDRSLILAGMTYDQTVGFDLRFSARNPYVEDTGQIDQLQIKDNQQTIQIEEETNNGNN